jgi:hypothetical protein
MEQATAIVNTGRRVEKRSRSKHRVTTMLVMTKKLRHWVSAFFSGESGSKMSASVGQRTTAATKPMREIENAT